MTDAVGRVEAFCKSAAPLAGLHFGLRRHVPNQLTVFVVDLWTMAPVGPDGRDWRTSLAFDRREFDAVGPERADDLIRVRWVAAVLSLWGAVLRRLPQAA